MPPSLREVAWRVPRKRHDGGGRMRKGEDSLSLASLDSSLREGAEMPLSLRRRYHAACHARRMTDEVSSPSPRTGKVAAQRPDEVPAQRKMSRHSLPQGGSRNASLFEGGGMARPPQAP